MTPHLSSASIDRYLARTLPPAELLALQTHIRDCESCREALAESFSRTKPLDAPLFGESVEPHLTEDEMVAWVAGRMTDTRARTAATHLKQCVECAEGVGAMESVRTEMMPRVLKPRRRWVPWSIAAAAIVAVGIGLYLFQRPSVTLIAEMRDGGETIGIDAGGKLQGLASATGEERNWVREALRRETLPDGPKIMTEGRGQFRVPESAGTARFSLIAPLNSRLLDDRPTFSWHPEAGAKEYQVVVTSEALDVVARSPRLAATEWRPESGLPRAAVLFWQVRAWRGGTEVTAPAAPDPPARFEIASAEVAKRIAELRAAPRSSHLLLAVVCAREGLRAEALQELAALAAENPGVPVVEKLRNSL
jgi:hypothetical protein